MTPALVSILMAASASLGFVSEPAAPGFGTVVVTGLPPGAAADLESMDATGLEQVLAVWVGESYPARQDWPPVLGSRRMEGDTLRFTPRFAFTAGLTFHARFDGSRLGGLPVLETTFTMPSPARREAARVEAVFPSADVVPDNLLRLYVHFTAPMMTRDVHRYVHLFDDSGAEVPLAFVEIPEGLWDPGQRRLTLFFHPGRIKRGVAPRETLGPILQPGRDYRLVIDAGLPDAAGAALESPFEKRFTVAGPDRESPAPGDWAVHPPAAPLDAVALDFPEPLDRALLGRLIRVEDAGGHPLAGRVVVSHGETRWQFVPGTPWSPGPYKIIVHPALEDIAGNAISHRFETGSPEAPVPRREAPIEIPFRVK